MWDILSAFPIPVMWKMLNIYWMHAGMFRLWYIWGGLWGNLYPPSCRGTSDILFVNVSEWCHEGQVIFSQAFIHVTTSQPFVQHITQSSGVTTTKREQRKRSIPDKPVGGPARWRWGWEWRRAGSSIERSDWCDTSSSRTPRCCSQSGPEGAHTSSTPVHASISDKTLNDTVKFRHVVSPFCNWINQ